MKNLKKEVILAFILAIVFVVLVVLLQFLRKEPTRFIYQFF